MIFWPCMANAFMITKQSEDHNQKQPDLFLSLFPFTFSLSISLLERFPSGHSQVFQNRSVNVPVHHPKPAVSLSSWSFFPYFTDFVPWLDVALNKRVVTPCMCLTISGQNLFVDMGERGFVRNVLSAAVTWALTVPLVLDKSHQSSQLWSHSIRL